ncbi:cysteine protease StiP domain-containing protein [Deinococcus sp.]|uniref:cysteine protease StiP domain-containing protein n=1 Tax=Deinococcus sp. TaxID=47478 RepID=UPI003C7CE084
MSSVDTSVRYVQSSYAPADIQLLIGAAPAPQVSLREKEARIAAGESYGHFLTPEAAPTALQTATYHSALRRNGPVIASALLGLATQLEARFGGSVTLVSLARAGFPVGALLHRLLHRRGLDSAHYGVSIVRGVGLDMAALETVLAERPVSSIVFVDGWTGKGSILDTLQRSLQRHAVRPHFAALYDPAGVADMAGSHADLLLPHAALNATVSGLMSRSFLTMQRHAAEYLHHLAAHDLSNVYLDALEALCADATPLASPGPRPQRPADLAFAVARRYGCTDPHRAKPGIGEATRVFLRRLPAALIIRASTPDTGHLETLARAGHIPVHTEAALPYAAMSLIQELPHD